MRWPLIRYLPNRTNFQFVRFARFAATLSIAACLASFLSMATGGFRQNPIAIYAEAPGGAGEKLGAVFADAFNYGIDFKGGTLLELRTPGTLDIAAVRNTLSAMGLGDVQVQTFGEPGSALIRFESPEDSKPAEVVEQVKESLDDIVSEATFPRVEVVGPKVSAELFTGGVLALGLAIVLMLIYIWFRFEWQFGLGAVLGLFHDIILTLGLFSLFRLEFTLTIIAALLTIIGYSMNDTVVVFDRLRENLRKFKKRPLVEVIDLSLNETLSRTIVTGMTALLALLGLLFVGGEALSGFAIAMIFGIIMGTYSSIYVATPAILVWGVKRGQSDPEAEPVAARP
jgi:preprotein translocase SecF subunit